MAIKETEGNTQASEAPISQPQSLPAISPDNMSPIEPDSKKHGTISYIIVDKDVLLTPRKVADLGGKGAHWIALLFVQTSDIPRMMRQGFHWSSENLHREHGFMTPKISIPWPMGGEQNAAVRSYFLADLSEERWWSAELKVIARPYDIEALSRFRLSDLSPSLIFNVVAMNDNLDILYFYDVFRPKRYINTIYDDMPLGIWWPSPKKPYSKQAARRAPEGRSLSSEKQQGADSVGIWNFWPWKLFNWVTE